MLPTIDHLVPVARGGPDNAANWVTTSMARNAAKGASTLEQLGWHLHPQGDLREWDGMAQRLLNYVELSPAHAANEYIKSWLRALRSELPNYLPSNPALG